MPFPSPSTWYHLPTSCLWVCLFWMFKWNHIHCGFSGLGVGVPLKFTCGNLTPKVMVWGVGPLRRWWGHESRDPMNGINTLTKEIPKEPPQPFLLVRTQWRTRPPPRTELHQNLIILTPSSQMSGLQICRKCTSVAEAPSLLFCYGSPSQLRQCILLHLLLLLSSMCLRCIHIIACVRASLLFMAASYSTVSMDHILLSILPFIHPSSVHPSNYVPIRHPSTHSPPLSPSHHKPTLILCGFACSELFL